MLYITGDTHADFARLSKRSGFEAGFGDSVIICGDFGGIWDNSPREKWVLNWLSQKPFNILFIDGNHENFDILNSYPIEIWNGGKVHKIRDNIIHLMRGQVFTIDKKSFFTMGGASSHDIKDGILDPGDPEFKSKKKKLDRAGAYFRINGVTWWPEEIPSKASLDEGLSNLKKYGNSVDYIITHCAPTSVQKTINSRFEPDKLTDYLEEVKEKCEFKHWFFGHYHDNKEIGSNYTLLYSGIDHIG